MYNIQKGMMFMNPFKLDMRTIVNENDEKVWHLRYEEKIIDCNDDVIITRYNPLGIELREIKYDLRTGVIYCRSQVLKESDPKLVKEFYADDRQTMNVRKAISLQKRYCGFNTFSKETYVAVKREMSDWKEATRLGYISDEITDIINQKTKITGREEC